MFRNQSVILCSGVSESQTMNCTFAILIMNTYPKSCPAFFSSAACQWVSSPSPLSCPQSNLCLSAEMSAYHLARSFANTATTGTFLGIGMSVCLTLYIWMSSEAFVHHKPQGRCMYILQEVFKKSKKKIISTILHGSFSSSPQCLTYHQSLLTAVG